ncbi:MAG: tryptophan synthase subunit alpha [Methylococcales bacterium]
MPGKALEQSMIGSREKGKTELIFFVNAGDPDLDMSYEMLRVLARQGVAAVELCVPFPKSLTDGPLIRASHKRALSNGVDFDTVLDLAGKAREELGLAIVLLADYSHTVQPLGIANFLERCAARGVSATLIHCLPPLLRKAYVRHSEPIGLGRIMSFFAGSDDSIRAAAYRETLGYLYVVSRFGRTGNRVRFDPSVLDQITAIRSETDKPLAVGFGVKSREDVEALRSSGADAVIIGSAATSVVERNLATPEQIPAEFEQLVRDFASVGTPVTRSSQPYP